MALHRTTRFERVNDAVWGWAVDRVKRKHDRYWWVGRISYLFGRVIDRG